MKSLLPKPGSHWGRVPQWLSLSICLLAITPILAQTTRVEGTVTDAAGEPLIAVTVLEKGTSNGTVTDLDGKYVLNVADARGTVVFSSIGFETVEVLVGNQSTIDISLNEDITSLEEITVVGFGTEKRVNLSGAVDQVNARQLERRPISNVTEGLQGVVPNLNIDNFSGAPGSEPNINIRGITSINGGNPLILIDGIPSEPIELTRLNPQDVQSISVIKDASAAAIYGARAAFGVILVTTKTGTRGMSVDYNGYVSFNRPTVIPDKVTDPYIYTRWRETSTDNTPWDNQNFSDQTYEFARNRSNDPSIPAVRENPTVPGAWEYMGDRNWADYFLEDYTVSHNHQLSIRGGSEDVSYLLSGSYSRENGILSIADDYFDRYTVRGKVNYTPVDWLTIGNNTALAFTERRNPSYFNTESGDVLRGIYNLHPTDWNINPDGSWANSGAGRLAAQLTNGGNDETDFTSVQSQFTTEVDLLKDIVTWNSDFTFRRGQETRNWFQVPYTIGFGPNDFREEGASRAFRSNITEDYYVLNTYLKYSQNFGAHSINVTGGFNQEFSRYNLFSAERRNLISFSLPTLALATGDQFTNEEVEEWAVRGVFYRVNYIFDDRYIIEFNGRYDGSSRFPEEDRFGFFPSMSAAWRIDEEAFMAPTSDWISQLKVRGSIGSLGNQAIGPYDYIASMNARPADYLIGGALPLQISTPQIVSSNFTWERVTTTNVGVDAGFFDDRITASFDYFVRTTKDMLTLGRELPSVLGANEPLENAADLATRGWELALGYQNEFLLGGKPLNFQANFILSDSRTEITRFDNPSGSLTQYREGMELGEIWGLTNDGYFQSEDEIAQLDQTAIIPWGALSIVPGWPRYVDRDGNGLIEKGLTTDDPKDLRIIGNQAPRFRYGFNFSADWNGFDISALFQGIGQRDYYPQDYLYWGFFQQPYAGGAPHTLDYYRAVSETGADRDRHSQAYLDAGLADQNLDAEFPHLQAWLADRNLGERIDEAQGLAIPQTDYLLNASYLRFKNLTLGYTLPAVLTDKVGLGNVRFYFSGENLAEWSEIKDFFDPEAINDAIEFDPSVSRRRDVGKGNSYAFQRRYAVGLMLGF